MDPYITEVMEHVTRLGIEATKIPVLTPDQIGRLTATQLIDPDFIYINKVDVESNPVLNAVLSSATEVSNLAKGMSPVVKTVGLSTIGSVVGAGVGWATSDDEHKREAVVAGAAIGGTLGFLASLYL